MKNITMSEYKSQIDEVAADVLGVGDIVRVDVGKKGALVIMEEPEYNIMRETFQMIIALNNAADKDGNVNIKDLLKKHKK